MNLLSVIASQVIVSHCFSNFVILTKSFRLSQKIQSSVELLNLQHVNGHYVANIANLKTSLRVLLLFEFNHQSKVSFHSKLSKITSQLCVPKFVFLRLSSFSSLANVSSQLPFICVVKRKATYLLLKFLAFILKMLNPSELSVHIEINY